MSRPARDYLTDTGLILRDELGGCVEFPNTEAMAACLADMMATWHAEAIDQEDANGAMDGAELSDVRAASPAA